MSELIYLDIFYKGGGSLDGDLGLQEMMKQYRVSFEYTDSRKEVDRFQLSLDGLPHDAADRIEVEEDDEVTMVIGVRDAWEIRRQMIIDEAKTSYEASTSVTLTGRCKAVKLLKKSGRVWKNKTDSEIAEEIARIHGFSPDVQVTTEKRDFYAQGQRTYMKVLQDLAEDNGFYVKVQDETLIFARKGYELPSVITLYRGNGKSPELESFSVSSKRSVVTSGSKVSVKGQNKGAGKAEGGEVKDAANLNITHKNQGNYSTSSSSASSPMEGFLPGEAYRDPENLPGSTNSCDSTVSSCDDTGGGETGTAEYAAHGKKSLAKKRAASVSERILWKGVSASARTRNQRILSNQKVNIAGAVAKKHAGAYYAEQTKYALDGLSWAVDLELSRKPLKTKASKGQGKDKGTKGKDKGKAEGAEGGKEEMFLVHKNRGAFTATKRSAT